MEPFKYITVTQRDAQWGLSVSTVGTQTILPGMPYPPTGHNKGYNFNPDKGRVLGEYQLLYIVEGRGTLKTAHLESRVIRSGDMFLLFPGEWHTYRPDPQTGWKEYWIGFSGGNFDHRVKEGFFSAGSPVYNVGYNAEAVSLYQSAIKVAGEQKAYFQQLLSGIANHLLGLMVMTSRNRTISRDRDVSEMVDNARTYMLEHLEEKVEMPQVAQALSVSYTSFRRMFKSYTGIAPGQYLISQRIHRARELLRGTDLSVKEIAYRLQFESPEYFATQFRLRTGQTPSEFREK